MGRALAPLWQLTKTEEEEMNLSRVCYFFCSNCNHVFKKEDNLRGWKLALATSDVSPSVSGTLTCQYCGHVIQCQEIYAGKYDVPRKYWPDLPPPHEV